jgi:NAD(P)-dependent dehydrogenase (short-subunit alcohol dehydrogenase family)
MTVWFITGAAHGPGINISSSGGFIGRAGWGVYCSAKFAVEGLSESLGHQLAPLGIQVTAVEPGGFRTNFLDDSSLITAQATIEDYAGTAGATRQWAKQANYAQAGDPVKAAKAIVDLAGQESLPERIQLGEDCFTAVASSSRAPPVTRSAGGKSRSPPVTAPDGHGMRWTASAEPLVRLL